ncbi:MAG TPA: glycosyltransferase [Rhodospirillales bacterium]|nr:glycosyltransferase [Rhodospirillales bacterium]
MLDTILLATALLSLIGWMHLRWRHGGFWRSDQRLPGDHATPSHWPRVTAIVPARNEEGGIGRAVRSLLAQDYPGPFSIVVVDDNSTDDTAGEATRAAAGDPRLVVATGAPLSKRWSGKLWAVHQGERIALTSAPDSEFLLLTDADIEHDSGNLRRLVAVAQSEGRDLVSLMVWLRCETFWERLLVPPFIFFFQKLYPFPRVNDTARPEAAAAGGCMLVRATALHQAGGIAALRGHLIDDCALAARIKRQPGSIWLGLCDRTRSLRPYSRLRDVWSMVARTAFTQLDHSGGKLLATIAGMLVLYATPPLAVLFWLAGGSGHAAALGTGAWALMAASFAPTLQLYRLSQAWSLMLPVAACLYILMTVDSARLSWQGRGGVWKGRSFDADAMAGTSRKPASLTETAGRQ